LSGCGGVLQLWPGSVDVVCCAVMNRVCRVASSLRLSAEKLPGSVMAIARIQTGVSWHFRSFKDDVLKIEL